MRHDFSSHHILNRFYKDIKVFSNLSHSKMSRVCLITGGTQGIGQETAELLASSGWKVVISGRNSEKGKQVRNFQMNHHDLLLTSLLIGSRRHQSQWG